GDLVREIVGTIEEPDLEAIAALEPDLILSATVRHEEIYDELSQIAPTVFTESSGTNWKEGFTLAADALGRAEEGEQALADYRERAERVRGEIGADKTQAAIVRF
ncbi:MAG: ABC transporter substrate-binding protein, partial [Actinobacteria bacterium]|nr:ABC transporter substrate-binding protein [Actinomycetota bacterium]